MISSLRLSLIKGCGCQTSTKDNVKLQEGSWGIEQWSISQVRRGHERQWANKNAGNFSSGSTSSDSRNLTKTFVTLIPPKNENCSKYCRMAYLSPIHISCSSENSQNSVSAFLFSIRFSEVYIICI